MPAVLPKISLSSCLPRRSVALPDMPRTLRRLVARLTRTDDYRPERHYMRGGATPGCRNAAPASPHY